MNSNSPVVGEANMVKLGAALQRDKAAERRNSEEPPKDECFPLELLPKSVHELADVIGIPSTLALIEVCGGTRLYIPEPTGLDHDHILVNILGEEEAKKMVQHYAGDSISLPRCAVALYASGHHT